MSVVFRYEIRPNLVVEKCSQYGEINVWKARGKDSGSPTMNGRLKERTPLVFTCRQGDAEKDSKIEMMLS